MTRTHVERPLLALLALAFAVQAMVPAGWMPARAANGFILELCSGRVPGGSAEQLGEARALLDKALAGTARHQKEDGDANDQPCAFVGVGVASLATAPALPIAAPVTVGSVRLPSMTAAVGQGLAAPPPPATAPPSFA